MTKGRGSHAWVEGALRMYGVYGIATAVRLNKQADLRRGQGNWGDVSGGDSGEAGACGADVESRTRANKKPSIGINPPKKNNLILFHAKVRGI